METVTGGQLGTLSKYIYIDETGLEILGCRHNIAQAAINMFYGKVYGYAHYLQKGSLFPTRFSSCGMMSFASTSPGFFRQIPIVHNP